MGKASEKDVCIYISESLNCIPECNTTLQINHTSVKINVVTRAKY